MRLFVALPLGEVAEDALARICEDMPVAGVDEETWHITLHFAGEWPERMAEDFADELARIHVDPFAWWIEGVDLFGGERPRLLHAKVGPPAPLADLSRKVRSAARAAGLEVSHRRFVPHVTLARLKGQPPDARLSGWIARNLTTKAGPFAAEGFGLYLSELRPEGARHTEIMWQPF
ncbi:RNA 2',3'-cyclic phosphodiesterase [Roseobacter sp. HKCCA0434]|uniref:RNA 2',3'-cyclic phosphodiesterase n=1 Tax=Roseobacter sp. HKCCA0434 TaxID=3079297 RepID=UPI002905F166|nr:RNA 2',3'-cyclic phosphodiesterase [Roseobacter sp. HKCCA0434]